MDRGDLAWAAGLFDGEGCVYLNLRRRRDQRSRGYELHVSISMTHRPTIERLARLFGGNCWFDASRQRRHPQWKPQWLWALGTQQALSFLRGIRRYSITKQQEIWLALEWAAARRPPHHGLAIDDEEQALQDGFALALRQAKRGGQ